MSCIRALWLGWLLCALLPCTPAAAQPPARAYPPDDTVAAAPLSAAARDWPDRAPKLRWYGWQTLASDGVALGLLALPWLDAPGYFVAPALLLGALGPAVIHAAHGNWAAGASSLALRLLGDLVIGIGMVRIALSEGVDSEERLGVGILIAGAAITLAASALDAAFFSYARDRPGRRHAEMHILPWASARSSTRAAGLSLRASF